MEENFEPLNKNINYSSLRASLDRIVEDSGTDTLITFAKDFKASAINTSVETENYVIENYSPFKINKANSKSPGKVFIQIIY